MENLWTVDSRPIHQKIDRYIPGKMPYVSYSLVDIFKRLYNNELTDGAHNAEADVVFLLKTAIATNKAFVEIAESTLKKF